MIARYENIIVKTLTFGQSTFGEQTTTQTEFFQTRAVVSDVANNVRISEKYRTYSDVVSLKVNYTPYTKAMVDNLNLYSINWRNADWRIDNGRETNDRQHVIFTLVRNDPTTAV
jgi:hypothetical protein